MTSVPEGYQPLTRNGPRVRTDVVDVYVFKREQAGVQFLQLLRSGPPLAKTWHPVMGHIEADESAVDCAKREVFEELGLVVGPPAAPGVLGMWALEQVHPFYIAAIDTIVMSPRFAVEVSASWSPTLNAEHEEVRWVSERELDTKFMWPGQIAACRELLSVIVRQSSIARDLLRIV